MSGLGRGATENQGETVALRWTGSGTHQGELMGVAPTSKQVNSSGNTFLRLENGKIAEEWCVFRSKLASHFGESGQSFR